MCLNSLCYNRVLVVYLNYMLSSYYIDTLKKAISPQLLVIFIPFLKTDTIIWGNYWRIAVKRSRQTFHTNTFISSGLLIVSLYSCHRFKLLLNVERDDQIISKDTFGTKRFIFEVHCKQKHMTTGNRRRGGNNTSALS